MKRLSSSDSLGAAFMSICPNTTDEHNSMYSMLEEDCCLEESSHVSQKKRRLSIDQVKALEKNFEVDNKLEPERKVKLAEELGLQPRQVAVWFQNRRARWKTKQLERDYGALKANYDGLKLNFQRLQHDKESLLKEIHELKSKLDESGDAKTGEAEMETSKKFGDLRDGSSDSDSSAVLNDDNNNNNKSCSRSSMNVSFEYQPQLVKMEEHNFFGEESCSTFFSDEQAPTLPWYCNNQWN